MRPVRIWSCPLAWGFALIVGWVSQSPVIAEENRPPEPVSEESSPGPIAVRDAVNGELFDLARALRSLDQSYAFRGVQGCGAWTAGSAYMDWHAQGVCPPPAGTRVLPPPPLVLGGCRSRCRSEAHYGELSCEDGGSVLPRRICSCGHVYPRDEQPRCNCHGGEIISPQRTVPQPETREPTPVDTVPPPLVLPVR